MLALDGRAALRSGVAEEEDEVWYVEVVRYTQRGSNTP